MLKKYRYEDIDRHQRSLYTENALDYSAYLEASERLAELMLGGMERLPKRARGNEASDPITSMTAILVRLFNDFEAVKLCALNGLPDQSNGHLRDSVECMMMIRLFQADPSLARRWLTHGNEYTPADVYAVLDKKGISVLEYALYGFLSDRTHPNLFGSLSIASETGESGVLIEITWGIGGYRSPFFIRLALFMRCLFQIFALQDPLGRLFVGHFSDGERDLWRTELRTTVRLVGELLPESDAGPPPKARGMQAGLAKIKNKGKLAEDKMLKEMRKLVGQDFNFDK